MVTQQEEDINQFDRYAEALIPTKARITRKRGNLIFLFNVKAFKGVDTDELYYHRNTLLALDNIIEEMTEPGRGRISSFVMPQIFSTYGTQTTAKVAEEESSSINTDDILKFPNLIPIPY